MQNTFLTNQVPNGTDALNNVNTFDSLWSVSNLTKL
ncbi:unnamed protein product [Trichobilharzia regenti]|nr:unnamed protein product [Trichobilharzia regenti]